MTARTIDAADLHMIRHAAKRGPVEVRDRTTGRWAEATLIAWHVGNEHRGPSARVIYPDARGARTVRHADMALPEAAT